jgi:hypothetical protein
MNAEFKPIAQRIVNAENDFIEVLMAQASISKDDAIKAMRAMLKMKVAKLDAVSGRISVKHGAYLDADVIKNAANA